MINPKEIPTEFAEQPESPMLETPQKTLEEEIIEILNGLKVRFKIENSGYFEISVLPDDERRVKLALESNFNIVITITERAAYFRIKNKKSFRKGGNI